MFLSAADVEAIRREEERALEALRGAEAQVRDRVEDAVAAADEAVEAFVAGYPTRLHFVFEFNPEVDVTAAPYWVEGMWHDTQSTFIRFRRVLDDEIVVAGLLPDGTARVLAHEVIGVGFVIRVDGVVEAGILGVGDLGAGAVRGACGGRRSRGRLATEGPLRRHPEEPARLRGPRLRRGPHPRDVPHGVGHAPRGLRAPTRPPSRRRSRTSAASSRR